ncbi:phosphocarrier protein HPr [Desulfovibrionales bacterium]
MAARMVRCEVYRRVNVCVTEGRGWGILSTYHAVEDRSWTVKVCVTNELGLHARPAARLAQEAQNFAATITLGLDGQQVDAKSVLDILTLAASQGCGLILSASGIDALAAIEHLVDFFQNRCGEDK